MSNKKFFTILTVVCILIVGAIFALTTDVVSDAINHFRGTEKVEQVVTDTKEEVTEYTIQDFSICENKNESIDILILCTWTFLIYLLLLY